MMKSLSVRDISRALMLVEAIDSQIGKVDEYRESQLSETALTLDEIMFGKSGEDE